MLFRKDYLSIEMVRLHTYQNSPLDLFLRYHHQALNKMADILCLLVVVLSNGRDVCWNSFAKWLLYLVYPLFHRHCNLSVYNSRQAESSESNLPWAVLSRCY